MSIKWAPLSVPMKRRMEVLGAFTFIMTILLIEIICVTIFVSIFHFGGSLGKASCAAYLIFFWFDRRAGDNCSRGQGQEFLRNWIMWRYFVEYFPIKLVKTVDLPPTQNYLFACFPHGVISCGAFGNFVTSASNFRQLFPGIRSKLCTLNFHFYVPLFRELALGWGMMSAKASSIKYALTQPNDKSAACNADGYTSNAIGIIVGGAQEALNARPGVYKLVLKRRKGFIKIALQTGAPLVPVFGFNEVEIFDQPSNEPGTKLRMFQDFFKKWTGIAPAFFMGRGFFQYSFGLIPRRHPITTVVGAPIIVPRNPNPSQIEIDDLHSKFVDALTKVFEDNKEKYLKNADKIRLIIE